MIRLLVQQLFALFGFRLSRLRNYPQVTLLGLKDRPINSVIDVGANVGQFAHRARQLFPNAALFCFEPQPDVCRELRKWAQDQGAPVTVFELALGDSPGFVTMLAHVEHTPSSSLLETTQLNSHLYPQTQQQREIRVAVSTLDAAMAPHFAELANDVLVKIDVQGYEDRVIAGAEQVLCRASACIVEVNVDSLYVGQPTFERIASQLNSVGLSYAGNLEQVYGPDGHVAFLDALFVRRAAV
jgi:FkbM family methyltransferase